MRVPSSWLYERASSASVRGALAFGHVSADHLPALVSSENTDKDAGHGLGAEAKHVVPAPASDVRLTTHLTGAQLRDFVSRADTQRHIRKVIVARLNGQAPAHLIDDLVQQANLEVLASKSPPRSMATANGWVAIVAARTIAHHFRRDAVHAKWLKPEVEVEELATEAAEADGASDPKWLITNWLGPLVVENARDQETYELLLYKARTGKTHAEVAADHAMTEGALKTRIRALKTKYEPQWRRRQRMILVFILLGAAATIAALVWLLTPKASPRGQLPPPATQILDRVLGHGLDVSHPAPIERNTDAGSR
jgi:DNA-directed RNA polymerase specialized sigma24 family protein